MTESVRVCECGCGASLEGRDERARYATDACRAKAWKAGTGYGPQRPRRMRSNGHEQSQPTRLHRALELAGSIGITQADFDAPDVIDGFPPIPQIARRIHDLRAKRGLNIITDGERQGFAVYKLAPAVSPGPVSNRAGHIAAAPTGHVPSGSHIPPPVGDTGLDETADALFDAPTAAPGNALVEG